MAYTAKVYNVMLATPNDVSEEKNVARDIILDWNNIHSSTRKVVLLPVSWDYNVAPEMGERPQEIINKGLLRSADILIGIFWTRIGTPTGKAISGSVEEIEEHINLGKPAMLYFSNKPVVLGSVDPQQYQEVVKLKKEYQSKGLTVDFDTVEDFKQKFQRHLSMKLNEEAFIDKAAMAKEPSKNKAVELSDSAMFLLVEISKDNDGLLNKSEYKGGFSYRTNDKVLNDDYSARTKARFERDIKQLLSNGFIESRGYKGIAYAITDEGFAMADEIQQTWNFV